LEITDDDTETIDHDFVRFNPNQINLLMLRMKKFLHLIRNTAFAANVRGVLLLAGTSNNKNHRSQQKTVSSKYHNNFVWI
jgi:hypothetical protein